MKKIFLLLALLVTNTLLFSQVTLDIPYENGQVVVVANITYGKNITKADSVCLEACYQGYDEMENPKTFVTEKTVSGKPNSIKQSNSFERRKSLQTFRVIVFLGGKKIGVSNEVQINYNGYKYNNEPLAKVTNLQATLQEVDGKKLITLTWDAVPNAFGYDVGEREWNGAEQYIRFQLGYGGPMSQSVTNSLTFEVKGYGVQEYGVIAVNSPSESISEAPFSSVTSIKIDVK